MAKQIMICPFSDRLCKECALYRGRHYYLRFCKKYRGYLGEPKDSHQGIYPVHHRVSTIGQFEMPRIIATRAIDPFTTIHKDNKEES